MARRRANGEGTIYARKDGRYEAALWITTTSGSRKRVRIYGKTRHEVDNKLTDAKSKALQGTPTPDRMPQVAEFLENWLNHEKCRPLTRLRHERVVRLYLRPGLGRYRLGRLTVRTVQDFLDQLLASGQSPATVHQVRKVLSAALTYAMRQEFIVRNVARLVEMPKYKPRTASVWTFEETSTFLKGAQSNPLYPAFVLLALYGLRRAEVVGIRWCDVDLTNDVLRIRQQVQRIDGELRQVELKTSSSEDDEPLLATARRVLVEHRRQRSARRVAAGATWQGAGTDEELVFTTSSGRPVDPRNLERSFHRIRVQLGLRRITPHGLRYGNATGLKNQGVHDRDIQAILRHNDVHMTRHYEQVDMTNKRHGLEKLEQALLMAANESAGCRQILPSARESIVNVATYNFGGSSQTRTGDTRLFRPTLPRSRHDIQSVKAVMKERTRLWLIGLVAVSAAVKFPPVRTLAEEALCSAE